MNGPSELTRTTLAVLFVGGLIATSFWILWPFLPALIWATTLVVATWPIMLRVQRRLWNKRGLAIAVMTLALLVIASLAITKALAADPVRLGLLHTLSPAPFYIAQERGYFRDAGLDVTFRFFESAQPIAAALETR